MGGRADGFPSKYYFDGVSERAGTISTSNASKRMALISELSAIILPIFICAGIGLFWLRIGQPFDSGLVSTLVFKISVPCLIIAIFAKVHLTPDAVAAVAGAALVLFNTTT